MSVYRRCLLIVLTMLLSSASVYANEIGKRQSTDTSAPTFTVFDSETTESAGYATVEIALQPEAPESVSVSIATQPATALAREDYYGLYEVLNFKPGETLKRVKVRVLDDSRIESTEVFKVRIWGTSNYAIANAAASVTIKDNDSAAAGGFSVDSLDVEEGKSASVLVRRDGERTNLATVNISTVPVIGGAIQGKDFYGFHHKLSFAPGVIQQSVRLQTLDDSHSESDEPVRLRLFSAVGDEIKRYTANVRILDNDAASDGFTMWSQQLQPALANACGACHVGDRFGFASLQRDGTAFSAEETKTNYQKFLSLISLDAPEQSRLLVKTLAAGDPRALVHGGGALLTPGDPLYKQVARWIDVEKNARCPDCGLRARKAYLAYVDQPSLFWALDRNPIRTDVPARHGARLMLQALDPASLTPTGAPVDFLPDAFCASSGDCDVGRIAANHAGDELVFECRRAIDNRSASRLNLAWNLCIAGIDNGGRAINPRFLRPLPDRHQGWTRTRSDPFGMIDADGWPLRGHYDLHYQLRQRSDLDPVYSADDNRVVFSSRSPDPRSGVSGTRTYHGFEHTNNIISTTTDGSSPRTLYLNEGGVADSPTFLRNGNLVIHTWNLERMDRHLYTQSTADGMMELPVLFGRSQGRNMWGPLTELANGSLLGMSGHRRGSVNLFVPFFADHTIGLGVDERFAGFRLLDPQIVSEMDEQFAYCRNPPYGKNCSTSRYYADPAYSPDGRAFISYHPNRTYYSKDDSRDYFYLNYGKNEDLVRRYVPELQIALINTQGQTETVVEPAAGRSLRFPTFVGKRWPPLQQPTVTDESKSTSELHIADFRLWLSFREQQSKNRASLLRRLDQITSVRVLVKDMARNACTNDGYAYRRAVWGEFDHPTHLGINNSTGYAKLHVPSNLGGDGHGNIPLKSDGSVRLRVPAGTLLLLQGIDRDGHLVSHHSRVFALPPGHQIDTSVRRQQHDDQCASCHGTVSDSPFPAFETTPSLRAHLDFDSMARTAVELADSRVTHQPITYQRILRPLMDNRCVSCHSGPVPSAELTLESTYSSSANAPAGYWTGSIQPDYQRYLDTVPDDRIVRAYNWSPTLDYVLQDVPYRTRYIDTNNQYAPMATFAPWDPGYQNLMMVDRNDQGFRYLSDWPYTSQLGRGGPWSSTSYLLEVLSGRDLDPRRDFNGRDHTGMLSEKELRDLMALIDNGFAYASDCDDRRVVSGPNAGKPWGEPIETQILR